MEKISDRTVLLFRREESLGCRQYIFYKEGWSPPVSDNEAIGSGGLYNKGMGFQVVIGIWGEVNIHHGKLYQNLIAHALLPLLFFQMSPRSGARTLTPIQMIRIPPMFNQKPNFII